MKVCLVVTSVLALLLSFYAPAQQMMQMTDGADQPARAAAEARTFRQDLLHRVALEEAAVREAESAHAANMELCKIYVRLGLLYEDLAQWDKSEAALEHAVSLLRPPSEPRGDLAAVISQLGSLHALMGKLRESEREEQEALKLREDIGDRLQIACSWNDLAALYLTKQKFEKARHFAQMAMDELIANDRAGAAERISARFALSEALCSTKDCPLAIPLLKAAIDEAKATMQPNDFPIGLANFILGYAYWKSGDMPRAGEYMERGTVLMNVQLGWGHPAYLRALRCYAKFLHENQNVAAADLVERRIRHAEAVVDVHSMKVSQGMFGFVGPR